MAEWKLNDHPVGMIKTEDLEIICNSIMGAGQSCNPLVPFLFQRIKKLEAFSASQAEALDKMEAGELK